MSGLQPRKKNTGCAPAHRGSEKVSERMVRDMAHWQLIPVERALERPAGGAARETGTPSAWGLANH
jgi:hypothetical protein